VETTTTAAPTAVEQPKNEKTTPPRERRWCGREGLVHHRSGYLHGEGVVGYFIYIFYGIFLILFIIIKFIF
jgi:hypothetical protein